MPWPGWEARQEHSRALLNSFCEFPQEPTDHICPQEYCHWLQISISPTKFKNYTASALRILTAKNCKEIDKVHFHLNLSKKEMMGSGVLPGLRGGEGNQWMKHIVGEENKKRWFMFLFLDIYQVLCRSWGRKTAQLTCCLTVLNNHRSNVWYSAKLRNSVDCQKKEWIVLGSNTWSIIKPYFRIDLKCIDIYKQKMTMYRLF